VHCILAASKSCLDPQTHHERHHSLPDQPDTTDF
jgi:hypothetical protein